MSLQDLYALSICANFDSHKNYEEAKKAKLLDRTKCLKIW